MPTAEVNELAARLRTRRGLPPPAERRRLRDRAGLSLQDVAVTCGVHRSLVGKWEWGERIVSDEHLPAYLAVLDLCRMAK
jgi:DNA-binding transcriptional regulator YiaG